MSEDWLKFKKGVQALCIVGRASLALGCGDVRVWEKLGDLRRFRTPGRPPSWTVCQEGNQAREYAVKPEKPENVSL